MNNDKQNDFSKTITDARRTIKRIFPNWATEVGILILVLAITITSACILRTSSNPTRAQTNDNIEIEGTLPNGLPGTPGFEISTKPGHGSETYTIEYHPSQMCFIGDSRTVAMAGSVVTEAKFIAKSAMGLDWFNETAAIEFEKIKDEVELCVVALGINDINNANAYVERLNAFAEQYPSKIFVYVNLGPVKEDLYTGIPNSSLEAFNKKMQDGLSQRWQIVDQYTFLSQKGFDSADGLHYSLQDSATVFAWIVDSIKMQTVTMAT